MVVPPRWVDRFAKRKALAEGSRIDSIRGERWLAQRCPMRYNHSPALAVRWPYQGKDDPVKGNSNDSAPSLRSAHWVLAALFAMNLLNYIDRFILAAVLPPIQETLHFADSDEKAGFLTTAFFISYALFSPIMGWLGDRMTRKYLLVLGVGIWSLATFGSGLAETYGGMLFARSLLGIGEATY